MLLLRKGLGKQLSGPFRLTSSSVDSRVTLHLNYDFTWTWSERNEAWFHGNGIARIDYRGGAYVVSRRGASDDGAFCWFEVCAVKTFERAQRIGEQFVDRQDACASLSA